MFDRIIFDSNLYVSFSAIFVYFSLHPLPICHAARCVHFIVPSGRRGALFFLTERMYRLNPLSVIILVCLGNIKNKAARQIASSLVLLV